MFTFQLTVFRVSFFMVLTQIQSVNTNKSNFVSFLVFVGAAASFTAKISFFETVAKREAIFMIPPQNSECPRIFQVTGANQKAGKLLTTDLVNTKEA